MLNCTDLACVLHHHHLYAHLHHLNDHLQDENSALGDGGDVDPNDIQNLLNDTDSELSSLSHLDAPNDVIYMICGVVIAMLLVGLIIILVALTISKLRKREDSSSSATVVAEIPQIIPSSNSNNNISNHVDQLQTSSPLPSSRNNHQQQFQQLSPSQLSSSPNGTITASQQQSLSIGYKQNTNVWVFPPLPPQPNIYCTNSQDALIQYDKSGIKGFKRQFSGRFKRLVSRTKQEPSPVIPPELKPQLKTIYVY